MSSRTRRAVYALSAVALLLVSWRAVGTTTARVDLEAPATDATSSPRPWSSIASSPTASHSGGTRRELYALAVEELQGLPLDAPPGTRVTLWVTWSRPLTPGPRVQLLSRGVALSRIAGLPGRSPVAVLSVPAPDLPDVLYGDRFGKLNVTIPAIP